MQRFSFFIIVIYLFVSCGATHKQTSKDNESVDLPSVIDTISVIESLPDTIYKSVDAIKYNITIFDTIHNPIIEDFNDPYLVDKGNVLTFRGNRYRNGNFGGRISGTPTKIVKDWTFKTAYDMRKSNAGQWGGGTGWTGQPLLYDSLVICSSLCSRLYLINWTSGDTIAPSIYLRNPIKGTPMLDPKYPHLLYVGHGVAAEKPWGCLTVDIKKGEIIQFFPQDKNAWRGWGAYDSSPLRVGDYVFRPGENGTLYKWYIKNDSILLHSTLRYTHQDKAPGIEASMAVYRNYGFTADNRGNILCVNLSTMTPVWHYFNHDDTDASLVIEVNEEDGIPYLYTGCEVDRQGEKGFCFLVKLNALTGKLVWEAKIPCKKLQRGDKFTEGGIFATPLVGSGNCSDRLFICCITNEPAHHGALMAIDKKTGNIIYSTQLDWYPWMSPIAFQNEMNEEFLVVGDTAGKLYLINGETGKVIFKSVMGTNFESSPAVRDNSFVLGSRGRDIYKFHVE